ncbi:ABC transporter permease [Luteimonas sp. RD2P54]|uniref:ABC transporter permease n=1 Tax=Luteimonas endophytica TaxID=3042023 RepID=A0ABT6JD08_9GAMM|nr:ABC transporter permease [Luteimonas endophytica]MDH5824711.1 ABC transporter permease [Luteimonas endophytica]
MNAHARSMRRAVAAPRWRSYALEARCEFLRLLREPMYVLPTLLFPALFYLLFAVLLGGGRGPAGAQLLANYGAFGVIGAGLFGFGVTTAIDRQQGFLQLKRALPVPPGAWLIARMAMAMLFAAMVSLLLMALAALVAGVGLPAGDWLLLLAVNVAGVLPFCALGMYLGALVGGNAAPALINLLFLPMAFLSGLLLPLAVLPAALATMAPAWPAYHLGQVALKVVGGDAGGSLWLHLAVLALVALAFFLLARRRLAVAG